MILKTRLSIDECRVRLAEAIDSERSWLWPDGFVGCRPIVGRICGNGFELRKRKSSYLSGGSRWTFYGQFVPMTGSTRIEGEFRMRPAARAFHTFFILVASLGLFLGIIEVGSGQLNTVARSDEWLAVGLPLSMLVFAFLLLKFSRWLSNEKAILTVLRDVLQARDSLLTTDLPMESE